MGTCRRQRALGPFSPTPSTPSSTSSSCSAHVHSSQKHGSTCRDRQPKICQAASRATDGHERTQRKLHDPRAQPVHSNCSSLRWSLHRSPVSVCRFHGSDWVRDRNPLGCDHHLPVLRDIRQGAVRNGQHGRSSLLSLLVEHPDIIHTYYYTKRASSLRYPPPSVSQKDNPIKAKQDTTLMLLNIHFFFKCQNFTSDTQLRMMLFVKTENTGKWKSVFTRKKRMC